MQPTPPPSPRWSWSRLLLIGCALCVTLAYYVWHGRVYFDPPPEISRMEDDHFNLLARGFRKGHLYLDKEVPPALIASKNPYDPKERVGIYAPHDASYYKGRFYIYFGPAPTLTLFLPFSALTGYELPIYYGVVVYCFVGYLALVSILLFLQRHYYPRAGLSALAACLVVLGGGTMMTGLLRRPNVWEVSEAAGFCFFTWTLFCLVRALHSRRAVGWTLVGGLALGLAVASRPTYILCSPLFALPLFFRSRTEDDESPRYGWAALFGAAVPCTLIVLGLFAYNYARFDSPFEFGQRYQLSGIIEGDAKHFSLSYLPYNLYTYGVAWVRWVGAFPFVRSPEVPLQPEHFGGREYTFGIFTNLPFALFALVSVAGLGWRLLRRQASDTRWVVIAVLLGAVFLTFAPLSIFFGSCLRYMVDFTPCIMLLACLGFLELGTRLRGRALPGLLRCVGWTFALTSVAISALGVVHAYDVIVETPPIRYSAVASTLNAPFRWLDRTRHPDQRPWDITLTFPADRSRRREPLLVAHKWAEPSAVFFVEYVEGEWVRFGYHESAIGPESVFSPTVLARAGDTHRLRVSFGEPDVPLFHGSKTWLRVHYDDRCIWEAPAVSPAGPPGRFVVGEAPTEAQAGPRFTGTITASPVSDLTIAEARPSYGGARLRFRPTDAMRNRAYPLLVTGVTHSGDVLFLRLSYQDELTFGYDHWGSPGLTAKPIPVQLGRDYVVEFWHPALAPAGQGSPQLVVKLDGLTVWQSDVPVFPFTSNQIHFGYNPIGGTSSQRTFDNGVFESTNLPFLASDAGLSPRGTRLRVRLTPAMRNRALPLAATGITGQGDILFLRLSEKDELTLGYDHWAAPCLTSAPIPVTLQRELLIDVWLPGLAPTTGAPPPLRVSIDGKEVWRETVSFYPFTGAQVSFGYNRLGGTSSEPVLEGAIVLDTNLPYPQEN